MFIGAWKRSTLLKSAALIATLALAGSAAACGASANEGVGGGVPAAIHCSEAPAGHGVDVVSMKLTCQVSGAATGATSFSLHYAIKGSNGAQRNFDATCDGKLLNGAGSCTQTYALVVPFDSGSATVSGEFLPTHQSIAPLAPAETK